MTLTFEHIDRKSSVRKHVSIICFVISMLGLNLQCSAAIADWQSESREAYLLLDDGAAQQAYERFRTARKMFQGSSSNPIALDLELSMVSALIADKRIDESQKILSRLKPIILQAYRGTLLEARYWRRCVRIHLARKSFAELAEAQGNVVRLVGQKLGDDCTDCMEERIDLLRFLQMNHQWNKAIDVATQCEEMLSRRQNDEDKIRLTILLELEFSRFVSGFGSQMCSRPDLGPGIIQHFQKVRPYDRRQIELLNYLAFKTALGKRKDIFKQIISVMRSKKVELKHEDLEKVIVSFVITTMDKIWDPDPITQDTIDDVEEMSSLADKVVTPTARSASHSYVQAKCLHAAMLAQTRRPDQGRQLLDSLRFSPSVFQGWFSLAGVFQARREVAKAYIARGKFDLAAKQYDDLLQLIREHEKPPKREKALHDWQWQKEWFLAGHLEK